METIIFESNSLQSVWKEIIEKGKLKYLIDIPHSAEDLLNSELLSVKIKKQTVENFEKPVHEFEFLVRYQEIHLPFKMFELVTNEYDASLANKGDVIGYLGINGNRENGAHILDTSLINHVFAWRYDLPSQEDKDTFDNKMIDIFKDVYYELESFLFTEGMIPYRLSKIEVTDYYFDDLPF